MNQQQPVNLATAGDTFFAGVDQRNALLAPAGVLADGENLRFTNGFAETRKGVAKPAWANAVSGSTIVAHGTTPYGAGVFRDPNGREWGILAVDGYAYRLLPHNYRQSIALPDAVRLLTETVFVQAFNKLYAFRGRYLAPLVLSDFETGFEDIVPQYDAAATYAANDEIAWGPFQAITSITRDGNTATVTTTLDHGYITGADITITGATQTDYNGRFNITVTGPDTFTYPVSGSPATPATTAGTLECSNMLYYWKANAGTSAGENPTNTASKWDRVYNVMPNASTALYINNRLLIPTAYQPASADNYATFNGGSYIKTDFIVATDYLDETHFSFADEFRINQGSEDEIVDLVKFAEDTVIVFKNRSWGLLSNVSAIDNAGLTLDFRETGYGLASRGGATKVGTDVYFYAGTRGIVSIKQSENGKILSVDVPLSAPIARTLNRINGPLASKVRLTSWQNKLYCAVPLDDATCLVAPPDAPIIAFNTDGNTFGTLTWNDVDTATSYEIWAASNPAETFTLVDTTTISTWDVPGRRGWVKVRARNRLGAGDFSNLVDADWTPP